MYRFHPRITVDYTWEYVAGPELALARLAAMTGAEGMRRYLKRLQLDFVVLWTTDLSAEFARVLETAGFVPVYLDNGITIMVPRRPEYETLIAREGYRWIRPWVQPSAVMTRANALQILAEAERAWRTCPERATFVHTYWTTAYSYLGRPKEARAALAMIPKTLVLR